MKIFKKSLLFLTLGALPLTLGGCKKKPLVIPSVDVNSITINLPERPVYNTGAIRSEGEFEFIDLYELSDFHGAVNYEPNHSAGTYIGLPKLATYFSQKRSLNPGGTVLLSCGDMFQGSADSNLTRGYMVNYSMQYMGFDAMAVGNHEFDWTDEWIKKNSELQYNTSTIPYLGANIQKNGEMPEFLHKSVVLNRGDYKIGVIGVIGSELENSILKSAIENYSFVKYQSIVDEEALRLKAEEGCNAVVLLAHEAADKIEVVSNVDAVFGGHAHEDIVTTNNGVPAVATLNYGQSVAHISLKFNKADKTLVSDGSVGNIEAMQTFGESLAENAGIKNILGQYAESIDNIKHIKLGRCNEELEYDKALKNICVNSMHETAVKFANAHAEAGIEAGRILAAYHNVKGGIRDNIQKGKIVYGDVYRAFPFDNEIVLIKVNGLLLKEKLIEPLNSYGLYRTFSKRSELKENEDYYICATDYLALTKTFSSALKIEEKDLIRTGEIVREVVANKIYEIGNVKNSKWGEMTENYKPVTRY